MFDIKTTFTRLSIAGTQELPEDSFQKRVSIGVNKFSLCVALINCTVGLTVCFFMTHSLLLFLGVVIEIMLAPLPIYLNHRRLYTGASLALYFILAAATFFFCCLLGNLAEVDMMIVVLMGSARFIFSNRRIRYFAYAIAILVLVAVQLNQQISMIHPLVVHNGVKYVLFWVAYLVVILLVLLTFNWYGSINDSLREWATRQNQDKDRFIANATHEIKSAFKSVFAIISILHKIEKRDDRKNLKEAISDIEASCKNTASIIDNIFEYERYKAGLKPKVLHQLIDIRLILENIVAVYSHFANEKDVFVEFTVAENIPFHIVCDEMKLRQIITNLLHNAIKFTNNDTVILIDICLFQRQLVISVKDCGDGIADDIRRRIFEPFVSQNPNGLGLGLYIVRELVAAFGGSVETVNNRNGGATITVLWPLPGPEFYVLAATASR